MSLIRSTIDVIGFLLLSLMSILESIVKFFVPKKLKMKSIAGEIALVTGGGGGLGRLISFKLADLGAIVVVWDINKTGIDETVELIRSSGGTCYGYVCNVCAREDVYKNSALLKEQVGKVSILVNNAGVLSGKKLLDTSDELIIRTMNVNIMSHFWTVKAFLPGMMEDNKGHILSIASLAGHVGIPKLVDYCTSKFAAVGFDEALRMELEADGYNINTTVVCPFFIKNTGMFEDVQSRFMPTLTSNDVADSAICAMRQNEKFVILPGVGRGLLAVKWIFPWNCVAMFLRGLVRDASPDEPKKNLTIDEKIPKLSKDQLVIHQRLAKSVSSSEKKP